MNTTPIRIRILDREFQINCPESERLALLEAATFLNDEMQKVRNEGKLIGLDRIAILVALDLAHQLLETRRAGGPESGRWLEQLHRLNLELAASLPTPSPGSRPH